MLQSVHATAIDEYEYEFQRVLYTAEQWQIAKRGRNAKENK
jgi:hypothetical protein